jgi:hypothetical protein
MKKLLLFVCCLAVLDLLSAQDIPSATKGVKYGAGTTTEGSVLSVNELEKNLTNDRYSGKVSGKVEEVCQEKGCWMKLGKSNGESLMVKFKDYKFFMPKDIVGKEVVLEGDAMIKEVPVKQLQHYAKDAGKSEDEIKKIKEPKKEVQFVAKGVLVL